MRVGRYLMDKNDRSESLLSLLEKIRREVREIHGCCIILRGDLSFYSIIKKFNLNYKKLLNEVQNLIKGQSNDDMEDYGAFLNDLNELDEKVSKFSQKIKPQKRFNIEGDKVIELTEEFLSNLEESRKKIEAFSHIETVQNPDKENKKTAIENAQTQISEKLENLYKEVKAWLGFYKLRVLRNKFVAHFAKLSDKKRQILLDQLSNIELLDIIKYITDEIVRIIDEKIELTSKKIGSIRDLIPVNNTLSDPFTAFMVPWLQPAYPKNGETEIITEVEKYEHESENYCEIKLESGYLFYVDNFSPNYEWKSGDKLAIFQSYNYQNPYQPYIICNFTKKQWCRGELVKNNGKFLRSWVLPDTERKFSLEKLQSEKTTEDIIKKLDELR